MTNLKYQIKGGFTLVELIVSITITAIIMVGVSAFFAGSFHNIIVTQNELDESQGQFNTNNIIRDKLTGVEEIIEPNPFSGTPNEIVVRNNTEDGDLPFTYIGNIDNKLVFKDFFVFNGMYEDEKSSDFTDIKNPGGITKIGFDYYITAPLENKIYKCTSMSNCSVWLEESGLDHPTDITTDGTDFYVSDSGNNRVIKIDLSKSITEFPFKLNFPTGVAYSNGSLYVSDTYNNRVVRIYDAGSKMIVVAGEGESDACDNTARLCKLDFPTGLVISGDGKSLFISDTGSGRILKITDPKLISEYNNSAPNTPYPIDLILDSTVSKIDFTFPSSATIDNNSVITNNLHIGKYSNGGNKLSLYLSVPLVKGDANLQDCTDIIDGSPCPIFFRRFTVSADNKIFENSDNILIDADSYAIDGIPSYPTVNITPHDTTNSYPSGTIVTITNNFSSLLTPTFEFDLTSSNLSSGFNLITTEVYDENGDIIESATTKDILRIGDGIIGTAEDIIEEVTSYSGTYPTGLGWDNGLQITGAPVYSTNFSEYDYTSSFGLNNLQFSTPNSNILQMDIETANEDTYVINSAIQ